MKSDVLPSDRDRPRILVIGASGFVARPVIRRLVEACEVWGAARFGDRAARAELDELGVTTVPFDLADPDFSALPDDVDYVINMSVTHAPDFELALAVNAENLGLVVAHYEGVKAFLHFSTMAVYAPKDNAPLAEGDALGDHHGAILPTYSLSKIAAESVLRSAARAHGVPMVIARLNVAYGDCFGWPSIHLDCIRNGQPIPVPAGDEVLYSPIHTDDIARQCTLLLGVASVPAVTVNWAGSDAVSLQEWCRFLGTLVGEEPRFQPSVASVPAAVMDVSLMHELIGPATVGWRDGMSRLVATSS